MTTTLYRFFDAADQLLYVGITDSPLRRFTQHATERAWWTQAARVTLEHYPIRAEAEAAEREAIRREYPPANIAHRLPLTWETLTILEPLLNDLLTECRKTTDPLAQWYGCTGSPGIKARLMALVGLGATNPDGNARPSPLGDDRAYELAYRFLWAVALGHEARWSA